MVGCYAIFQELVNTGVNFRGVILVSQCVHSVINCALTLAKCSKRLNWTLLATLVAAFKMVPKVCFHIVKCRFC